MSPELRKAIEIVQFQEIPFPYSFETIHQLFSAVIKELPDNLSVRKIKEQLK